MILSLVAGLALLVLGAEALVSGARRLALRLGITPIVIGLTIVAFGTSTPELVVSVEAARSGSAEIAVGNVVGSNVFNVLVILGLAALVTPLTIAQQLVRTEVPLLIGISVLTWVLVADGVFGPWEGAVFVAGIVAYALAAIRQSRRERRAVQEEYDESFGRSVTASLGVAIPVALVVAGLAALTIGAGWVIRGATALASYLGVSQLVIGLTVVAAGTSLPEVATSIVAAFRGERDIAVGNVIGSNIFNLLAVLGLSALVAPGGLDVAAGVWRLDLPVMIGTAALCLPIFFTGQRMTRWEGLLFLSYYGCYTIYLALVATRHPAATPFAWAMLILVPVTLLAIGLHVWHDVARRRPRAGGAQP